MVPSKTMEVTKRRRKKTKRQDIPKLPIKTYEWEDVRRSRKRGAYPWTHLTKPPFDEQLDPEEYTMDAFRRSRSSSTIGKSDKSETQDVSEGEDIEMKEDEEEELAKSLESHEQIPQDQQQYSESNKENIERPSSGSERPSSSLERPSSSLERPSSSLERPSSSLERPSSSLEKRSILKHTSPVPNVNESRAKSEEPTKKRKLSLESYAKLNLPKLAIKEKLKSAKSKIKVPKLPKRSKSDAADVSMKKPKLTKQPTESKPGSVWMPPPPNSSPVYIHIPLKPPPGEIDEFSKYEFESPGPSSRSGSLTQLQRIGSGRKMSLLGLLTEIKKVHDLKQQKLAGESKKSPDDQDVSSSDAEGDRKPKIELAESFKAVNPEQKWANLAKGGVKRKESEKLVIEEITDDDKKSTKSDASKPIVDEPEDSSADDNISQYLDKDDKCEIVSQESANVSNENVNEPVVLKKEEPEKEADAEKVRKLEATLSKWKKGPGASPAGSFKSPALATLKAAAATSPRTVPTTSATKEQQRPRAKSEEPKRKRKTSIESSYSRKSLSKLAFMKRLKEAKDKLKLPKFPSLPSFSKADKKSSKRSKPVEEKKQQPVAKIKSKLEPVKAEEPMYIHIPLKLPPGETDEFSHLAEETEEKVIPEEKKEEKKETEESESSVPTSPDVQGNNIQLIILTPPSDDEILDVSAPETPSESNQKFFDSMKIDELKNLAKKAVDQVCPESKMLETVAEDEGSDEHSGPESSQEPLEDKSEKSLAEEDIAQKCKILVDEEDGLKLSDAAIAMINEELAKELKEQQEEKEKEKAKEKEEEKEVEKEPEKDLKSSSLKKKVSFKRKSKAEDGERIYEDVQLSSDPAKSEIKTADDAKAKKLGPLDSFQSMSVDEEKSYLDKKVIKDTSLEDDYNKWSKLNDHEYEPVNPPLEEVPRGPSAVFNVDAHHQMQQPENNFNNKMASLEKQFVRIPPDNELIASDDNMGENIESVQENQKRIEERFFTSSEKTSPKPTPKLTPGKTDSSSPKQESKKKIITTITTTTTSSSAATPTTKEEEHESFGKALNTTLRNQADKIKTKLQGIKKPNIKFPQRPKFSSTKLKKPNFKKPSFKMPKMPEKPSINLPSFMTRKDSAKDSWRNRQFSTESNVSDSAKKVFDFKTYPRIFDKYKKGKETSSSNDKRETTPPPPEFATVPRANRRKGPVGSRWASKFKDITYADEDTRKSKEYETRESPDVIRIPLHPDNDVPMDVPSHTRYNEDIDIDDDFDRENHEMHHEAPINREYLKRWDHGEFHAEPLRQLPYERELDRRDFRVTDLDNDMEETQSPLDGSFDIPHHPKDEHSSGSLSEHRRGVLEEIDSDEFFLREKGISQENIEVGKYLSSEIREAFRNPINALSQLQSEDREYDLDVSDQSEPLQDIPRRKPLRKSKRKKTPHASHEKIGYDQESLNTEPEEYPKPFEDYKTFPPPARPKRRSKKTKKKKPTPDDVIPYQETIPIEEQFKTETTPEPSNVLQDIALSDEHLYNNTIQRMYENEHMKGIEQPEIKVSDPYYRYENFQQDMDKYLGRSEAPIAPTRRHRSLKSLSASERSSITEETIPKEVSQQNVGVYRAEQEYIIPTPEPPSRPRRTRSRTHSQSGAEDDRLSRGGDDDRTSRGAESLILDTQVQIPCVEPQCVEDIRDTSGYAVIDKSRVNREPPLPPSRRPPSTPPRRRRGKKIEDTTDKFSTVPRLTSDKPPTRPLRNYSTLAGSSRTSRSKSPSSFQGEEKENIDIGQYIEIEDEDSVKHLQSGEVIQKMKDRPLPAPPRPPRRPRAPTREVFRDISHERNIPVEEDIDKFHTEDIEISIQTEPTTDYLEESRSPTQERVLTDLEKQILPYEHEETITHAALVVQPIDNAQILPYSQLSRTQERMPLERTIPITQESVVTKPHYDYDDEETSEIPEEFTKLKSPPPKPSPKVQSQTTQESVVTKPHYDYDDEETSEIPEEFTKLKSPPPKSSPHVQPQTTEKKVIKSETQQEVGILKAQKMQVMDLDVDKLRVNELQANKIIVSELDGMSLQVSEINSKSGNLVVSGIELPPHIIQEMLHKLQSSAQEHDQSSDSQTIKIDGSLEQPKQTQEVESHISQKKNFD